MRFRGTLRRGRATAAGLAVHALVAAIASSAVAQAPSSGTDVPSTTEPPSALPSSEAPHAATLPPLPAPVVVTSSAPTSKPQTSAGQDTPESPGVWVHFDGPSGMRLEQDLDSVHHKDWDPVCTAPCVAFVSSALQYRVAGWGVKASKDFVLKAPDRGLERLRAHTASRFLYVLGYVGFGAGGVAVAWSFSLLFFGTLANLVVGHGAESIPAGLLVVLGAGLPVMLGGLALILSNAHTTVAQDVQSAPARAPSAVSGLGASWGDSMTSGAQELSVHAPIFMLRF